MDQSYADAVLKINVVSFVAATGDLSTFRMVILDIEECGFGTKAKIPSRKINSERFYVIKHEKQNLKLRQCTNNVITTKI